MAEGEAVVLIHGLLMNNVAMIPLAGQLRRAGYRVHFFGYGTRSASVAENARALARFMARVEAAKVHLVAHSLGGLVVLHLQQGRADASGGRVVLLGTPWKGSHVARWASRYGWGRWLCGHSLERGLLSQGPPLPLSCELGVIAGSLPRGLGWVVPGLPRPHDGTVAVCETAVPGMQDSVVLPVSHTGLLFTPQVANEIIAFLRTGQFTHSALRAGGGGGRLRRFVSHTEDPMAGHSKWANIQHRKNAQDAKRGKLFTKLIREITVAARAGGSDANSNPRLRTAIDKALAANMTKDTVERAVKRGAGGMEGENFEEVRYEGYAPGGIAVMVDCMTDNRNRTVGEVRHAFTKNGGNLGTEGSVAYLFTHRGVLSYAPGVSEDRVMELALEAGADDVVTNDDGSIDVLASPEQFEAVKAAMTQAGLTPEHAEVTYRAATAISVTGDDARKVMKLLDMLEDLEDVQNVYSNADISADVLAEAG